jgi:hypothetical protein
LGAANIPKSVMRFRWRDTRNTCQAQLLLRQRAIFALSVQNNLVHGSDSPENAELEIKLWFKPEELVGWAPAEQSWIG